MSHNNQQHSPLDVAYAQSLLDLAVEQQAEEAIGAELSELAQALEAEPQFQMFLESPGIGISERAAVIKKAFKGRVAPLLYNFLRVANQRGMAGRLRQVAEAYQGLLDERLGKIEVDVTVPQRLDGPELEQVRQRISQALGKDVVVHQYVDEDMIGGIILRVGDRIIDASVKAQLAAIRQQFMRAAIRR